MVTSRALRRVRSRVLFPDDGVAHRDDGLSLIEIVVAIGIFAVVMMLMSTMMGAGMRGVLLGKQRETAVQEMNRLLEVARSLSYDNIGLAQSDPAIDTDPAIVDVGGSKQYLVESPDIYEPIQWATNTANHPFNPHTWSFDRGPTKLTSYVYVTGVDASGNTAIDYKRVTVRVVWEARGTQGPANEVRSQTFISQSEPGSGAGVPLTAATNALAATASIRADRGSLTNLIDAVASNKEPVVVTLPSSQGSSRAPVPSSVECASQSTNVKLGSTISLGGGSVSSAADNDPTSGAPSQPPPQTDPGTLTASGVPLVNDVLTLLAPSPLSSPVTCMATALHDDGFPYERGTASGPSVLDLGVNLDGTGLGLSQASALKIMSSSSEQTIDHASAAVGRHIDAQAIGSIGDVRLFELPGVAPRGIVHVSPFSYALEAATATGPPFPSPAATVPGGIAIEVYDPTSSIPSSACSNRTSDDYCQATLTPTAVGFAGWSASFDGKDKNVTTTELKMDVSVNAMPPSIKNAVAGPNGETLWEAAYTAVSVSVRLQVSVVVSPPLLPDVKVRLSDTIVDLVLAQGRATGCRGAACR